MQEVSRLLVWKRSALCNNSGHADIEYMDTFKTCDELQAYLTMCCATNVHIIGVAVLLKRSDVMHAWHVPMWNGCQVVHSVYEMPPAKWLAGVRSGHGWMTLSTDIHPEVEVMRNKMM